MAIVVSIKHHTNYQYDRHVTMSPHLIRLKPAPHSRSRILSYSLKVFPESHFINYQQDAFGNYLARIVMHDKVQAFKVHVEVIVEMTVINPFDFFVEEYAEKYPFQYLEQESKELKPYFELAENGPLLTKWIAGLTHLKGVNIVDFLVAVNKSLFDHVEYAVRLESGVLTCEETLEKRVGSCRDSAWVLVQAMRHLGLAARFVSGYLIQLKADQKAIDGPSGPDEDFTDLHAWCEVYIPGAGWIGLDPTSGLLAGEGHIPLCCTPDPVSAAPISGSLDICESTLEYKNEVLRIHEDPRVTKPYSSEQWKAIMNLGSIVDNKLEQGDVRLTMGGEPTFVSIDDMESAQWNTTADGEDKRQKAQLLLGHLSRCYGKYGLFHHGQGKWYPDEPTPRWQLALYWRKDGKVLWKNKELFADIGQQGNYSIDDAHKLIATLCPYLGVSEKEIMSAYEDVFYYLWTERKLPANIDPLSINPKDSLERQALMKQLERGLDKPVAFVLTLQWAFEKKGWISRKWELRGQQLYLVPGDSHVGYRLPLESIPHVQTFEETPTLHKSPFAAEAELEDYHEKTTARLMQENDFEIPANLLNKKAPDIEQKDHKTSLKDFIPFKEEEEESVEYKPLYNSFTIKTALVVELRMGRLHVFMPPVDWLEHYLDILAAVENTCEDLGYEVVIEGYAPPRDNRLEKIMVTPDPGVIEVNVHPSKNWNELITNYSTIFECAKKSRLGAEKFMLDGKHTGTGGGNHITLGGSKASDSPLLRRPDLLRSMITFWQHHPGLSYLFSTTFVGPTSQAPRVDEGRQEMLYELEIAFDQIPEPGGHIPFWLVDRLLRNMLIDLTGNTHRAEFCIDKLYSPDSSTGRLGILELRGFDMPPSKEMLLVQLLLIRSLVSWFWEKPYKGKLVRWGTQLHDRFLTHHFVREDLKDVVEQLQKDGYAFELDWLEPFFEFRFPHTGRFAYNEIVVNLRTGIEPWHVLGEEMSSSGNSRFVDSSVEKLEIMVTGLNEDRYAILCNGLRVPMTKTAVHGKCIAAIRYRAWQPPSALHPNLSVDTPLVIDLYDLWTKKVVSGCTYHVYHPGGRSYDTFPLNSYEAEARRVSRFWDFNHSQNPIIKKTDASNIERFITTENRRDVVAIPPIIEPDPEYPTTFDLRKYKLKY